MEVFMNRITRLLVMGFLALMLLSCGLFNFSRNLDGTFRVETNLSLNVIQTMIENTAQFSDVVDMKLELRDGYIFVSAAQLDFQGVEARDVSFNLELGANNGQLTAAFTNVQVGNNAFDHEKIAAYNQMLAEGLAQGAQQTEQARLESVSVSPDGVKMVWQLDPATGN
jgi:hypothetical protein